ncbi:MAG: hypothetical protein ABIU77_04085 [Ferruginibacter sp.]|jgi:hypothetical protein
MLFRVVNNLAINSIDYLFGALTTAVGRLRILYKMQKKLKGWLVGD